MADETPFLFDDFFVDDADAGVTHTITVHGREVPIVCKRGITLADKEAATQAAVTRHLTPDGKVVVDGVDSLILAVEVLVRSVKSWPFTFRDGSPVPVTRENIRKLVSDAADALAQAIMGAEGAKKLEAAGPFGAASAEA